MSAPAVVVSGASGTSGTSGAARAALLAAAARVYAAEGWRGATTADVAREARVAESAIAAHFESVGALLRAAVAAGTDGVELPPLPHPSREASDAEAELAAWCAGTFAWVRERRVLLCRLLAELDERPDLGACAVEALRRSVAQLADYLALVIDGAGGHAKAERWAAAQRLAREVYARGLGGPAGRGEAAWPPARGADPRSYGAAVREALRVVRGAPRRGSATLERACLSKR